MKIGVVADTHSQSIPQQLMDDFREVDFIIHAGDFCSEEDLKKFEKIKEVKAVYGNMDEPKLQKLLPRRLIFKAGTVTIGLFHGEGYGQKTMESAQEEFKNKEVDIIIFGHSHVPFNQKIQGVLYFNPGSPNDTTYAPYRSYGILDVQKERLSASIIKVKE